MKPGRFDFPPVLHGDSFGEFQFKFVSSNDEPIDLSGVEIDLSIAKSNGSTPIANINGEVTDAVEGEYKTENFIVDLPPRNYWYDLTIIDENEMPITYIQGNIRILPNVNRYDI